MMNALLKSYLFKKIDTRQPTLKGKLLIEFMDNSWVFEIPLICVKPLKSFATQKYKFRKC